MLDDIFDFVLGTTIRHLASQLRDFVFHFDMYVARIDAGIISKSFANDLAQTFVGAFISFRTASPKSARRAFCEAIAEGGLSAITLLRELLSMLLAKAATLARSCSLVRICIRPIEAALGTVA